MEAERNALHELVYPELREFCAEHNARFQPIDLRWGVSGEASLDQQAMPICLGEIRRCHEVTPRPNFLVLLGNRYGWLPPPPHIPADAFGQILARVADAEDRELLSEWYARDDNAALARDDDPARADEAGWARSERGAILPEYYLRPRAQGGPYESSEAWAPVEARLRSIVAKAVEGTPLADDPRYLASATEQEIREGALSRRAADDQAFALFREITGAPDPAAAAADDPVRRYMDPDQGSPEALRGSPLEAVKDDLRDKLPDSAIREYEAGWEGERPGTSHLPELVRDAGEMLRAAIENELRDPLPLLLAPDEPPLFRDDEQLDAEGREHRKFAEERARIVEGREAGLEAVNAYLGGDDARAFVLHGAGGIGKSSFMAEAIRRAQDRPETLLYRFIGATPGSSNGRELLRSLCVELARRYEGEAAQASVPDDFQGLVVDFRQRLEGAGAARPLAVFIDSLDQLSPADGARSLSWLPSPLPPGVRLVASTRPGETLGPLERRDTLLEELGPLSRDDGARILERWLEDADRDLQPHQRNAVLDPFEASDGNPLWLRLGFEEARRWRSDVGEPETLAVGIAPAEPTTDEGAERQIEGIVARNTVPRLVHEDRHGDVLVSRALAYLAASRYGLAEDELLDLLSSDPDVYRWFVRHTYHFPPDLRKAAARHRGKAEDSAEVLEWLGEVTRAEPEEPGWDELDGFLASVLPSGEVSLPIVLWSRLFADLRPYLSERAAEGGALIAFYHRELDEVARRLYLRGEAGRACHGRMADYFRRQADPGMDRSWDGDSVRGLSELPYHLTEAADGEAEDDPRWQAVADALTDFRFLERKAAEVGAVTTGTGEEQTTTYTGVFQLQDDYSLALARMPGRAEGAGDRRRIIVTATDFGDGYVVRCPHCNVVHTFDEECEACRERHSLDDWVGKADWSCTNEACHGPLRVNEFTVPARQ